ncbi:hypothetical protein SGR_3575 [Streptomyces griseus subsp. griseus NBRC 13350]|uniref:Uncharacterized protein n=1 Tax=Streptomyces griseus subsp. griseus (strain JCM 4626 / CBS 651.72 / NBRC 13350 / KCC S-0626 / ISP 5235) TaxID=455632 RepID=B1VP25_STRGG|nr:hypothetical protein SGR_3575 [Streptomyces griseus subsp. griseus NBRC 13350]
MSYPVERPKGKAHTPPSRDIRKGASYCQKCGLRLPRDMRDRVGPCPCVDTK